MKKKKPSRSKLEKDLDKAWSDYIRRRDGVCQKCGATPVSAHHAFGRVNRATRWDVMNGTSLCFYHHLYWAHRDSCSFAEWFKGHVGADHYNRLAECHNQVVKFSTDDLARMLSVLKTLEV
jgi:hypothetical protein